MILCFFSLSEERFFSVLRPREMFERLHGENEQCLCYESDFER